MVIGEYYMKLDKNTFGSLSQFVQDELQTSSQGEQVKDFLKSNITNNDELQQG